MALSVKTPWLSVNSGTAWPGPGHGTPDVNSGTVPGIPGRLATLVKMFNANNMTAFQVEFKRFYSGYL